MYLCKFMDAMATVFCVVLLRSLTHTILLGYIDARLFCFFFLVWGEAVRQICSKPELAITGHVDLCKQFDSCL